MPGSNDAGAVVVWVLRHLDNLAPLGAALIGTAAWLYKRSGDRRRGAANPVPHPPALTPTLDRRIDVPRAVSTVAERPIMPPVLPPPRRTAMPASDDRPVGDVPGVTTFARRLGRIDVLRDAIVAGEIFGPPPGLR